MPDGNQLLMPFLSVFTFDTVSCVLLTHWFALTLSGRVIYGNKIFRTEKYIKTVCIRNALNASVVCALGLCLCSFGSLLVQ